MKRPARWITFAALLPMLFAAFAVPGAAGAARPAQAGAAVDAPAIPWPVHISGTQCWVGSRCSDLQWDLYRDKTFTDGEGNGGRWRYRANTLTMQYLDGCFATFVGERFNGTQFAGEMNCRDGSDGHGTWSGFYVPGPR